MLKWSEFLKKQLFGDIKPVAAKKTLFEKRDKSFFQIYYWLFPTIRILIEGSKWMTKKPSPFLFHWVFCQIFVRTIKPIWWKMRLKIQKFNSDCNFCVSEPWGFWCKDDDQNFLFKSSAGNELFWPSLFSGKRNS